MCRMHLHQLHHQQSQRGVDSVVAVHQTSNLDAAFSAYSTLHFLRAYNRLVVPPSDTRVSPQLPVHQISPVDDRLMFPSTQVLTPLDFTVLEKAAGDASQKYSNSVSSTCPETPPPVSTTLTETTRSGPSLHPLRPSTLSGPLLEKCLQESMYINRRQRGEKRAIPEEQKDEKYYERRKRNNEAAKKSRDARKMREDRIALRAAILEQENAVLRAQNVALREEVTTLRQIILIN